MAYTASSVKLHKISNLKIKNCNFNLKMKCNKTQLKNFHILSQKLLFIKYTIMAKAIIVKFLKIWLRFVIAKKLTKKKKV